VLVYFQLKSGAEPGGRHEHKEEKGDIHSIWRGARKGVRGGKGGGKK